MYLDRPNRGLKATLRRTTTNRPTNNPSTTLSLSLLAGTLAEGSPKSPSVPAPSPAYGRGYEPAPTAEDVGVWEWAVDEREREEIMDQEPEVPEVEDAECVKCGRSTYDAVCDNCEEIMAETEDWSDYE